MSSIPPGARLDPGDLALMGSRPGPYEVFAKPREGGAPLTLVAIWPELLRQ